MSSVTAKSEGKMQIGIRKTLMATLCAIARLVDAASRALHVDPRVAPSFAAHTTERARVGACATADGAGGAFFTFRPVFLSTVVSAEQVRQCLGHQRVRTMQLFTNASPARLDRRWGRCCSLGQ